MSLLCAPSRNFEKGNGAAEMLLFLPLALLLLFGITDTGLMFAEKAALADALRAGLNVEGLVLKAEEFDPNHDSYGEIRQDSLERLLRTSLDEIAKNIDRVLAVRGAERAGYAVKVSAVRFSLNTATGELLGEYAVIASEETPTGIGDPSITIEGYPYSSIEDVINGVVANERDRKPSSLATPVGLRYSAEHPGQAGVLYAPYSLALYAEVRSVARGVNASFMKSAVGRLYAIQDHELRLIRKQL